MTTRLQRRKAAPIAYRAVRTVNDFIDAIRIRVSVFIIEQRCPPGWEPEEIDKYATHYVAIVNDSVVATARLREDNSGYLKIERMAVKKEYRGHGVGKGLTELLVNEALKRHPARIWMEAQSHAIRFYEQAGFRVTSAEYDPWNLGIPHVCMDYQGIPRPPS